MFSKLEKKNYRNCYLDSILRKKRTISEARALCNARLSGINVPTLLHIDIKNTTLILEYIPGTPVKLLSNKGEFLDSVKKLGEQVRRLHHTNIIHGDLTTSNAVFTDLRNIFILDFGLSKVSHSLEDKAVDLLVFKRVLESTHYLWYLDSWQSFTSAYFNSAPPQIRKKLEKRIIDIQKRARYKAH